MNDEDPSKMKIVPRPEAVHPENAVSETPAPVELPDELDLSLALTLAGKNRSPEEEFFEDDPDTLSALSDPPPTQRTSGVEHEAPKTEDASTLVSEDKSETGSEAPPELGFADAATSSSLAPPSGRPSGELIDDELEDESDRDSAEPLQLERLSDPGRVSTPLADSESPSGSAVESGDSSIPSSVPVEPLPSIVGSAPKEPFPLAQSAEPPLAQSRAPSLRSAPRAGVSDEQSPASVLDVGSAQARSGASELQRQGVLSEWKERAEWLSREARTQKDSKQQARTLLVASELFAMVGDGAQARSLAESATKLSSGIAQRQARQLAIGARDYRAASGVLAAEAHAAATPAARAHAAFLNAEIERLNLKDPAASLRHFEQGSRAAPGDPRGVLARLCSQLASEAKPPSIRWPDGASFQTLELATRALSVLRGDTRWPSAELVAVTPAVAFMDAQRALERGDRVKASKALERLSSVEGFLRPAKWLASALLAPVAATRAESMRLLSEMLNDRVEPALRRALAARAVESGNGDAAQVALGSEGKSPENDASFAAVERLAIGALSGADAAELEPWIRDAEQKDELKPLAFALSFILNREVADASTDPEVASLLMLAKAVAGGLKPEDILGKLSGARGTHPLVPLLELEQASDARDTDALSEALLAWPGHGAEQSAIAHYVAGLLYEKDGKTEAAAEHYSAAVGAPGFSEAAVRARASLPHASGALAELFADLAETQADGKLRALLFLEAAFAADSAELRLSLLQRSHDASPDLPFGAHMGARLGLGDEHSESAIGWLGLIREGSDDAYEQALLLVREALLTSFDLDQARVLLEAAWDTWPKDIALHELCERLNPSDPASQALSREHLAKGAIDPVSKGRLLLEAAWLHEQASAGRDAARAARLASSFEPELAALAFERNAPGTPEASALKETWVRALATESAREAPAAARGDDCLRLADFEHVAANPSGQRKWLKETLRHEPGSLPALVQLEQLAFDGPAADDLASTEESLVDQLPPEDGLAHSLLWARLEREQKGWPAAFEGLKRAERGAETSLFVARQLQAQARRGGRGEDELNYLATTWITSKLTQPLDQAISHLRASEAATLLERPEQTLFHLQQAATLAPQHLVVLSRLAELLVERGDYERAAIQFERLAGESRVAAHRVAAWYDAAKLWLDELQNTDRGVSCLERVAEIDPGHTEVFERLLALNLTYNKFEDVAALIERRVGAIEDESERAALRLQQSRAYMRLGRTQAAKSSLDWVLATSPDDPEALQSLAELSMTDGDASGSEQALLHLVRLNNDPETQADIYMKLADLYAGPLENPERAERCYQEVLKRRPEDPIAFDRVLLMQKMLGTPEKAVAMLNQKLESTTDSEQRRLLHIALVQAYGDSEDEVQAAEKALVVALGQWPLDSGVLRCAGEFYTRHTLDGPLRVLVRRTQVEVEGKLNSGLLSADLTGAIGTLASAAGDTAKEKLAVAATRALRGEAALIGARGAKALARQLDDFTAPSLVGSALRALLVLTRGMCDAAFPLDVSRFEVRPLPEGELMVSFESKARAAGVVVPEVFVTLEGRAWFLGGGLRPRIVLGKDWLTQPEAIQDFVVWRSLKLIQAKICPFTRLEGEQLASAVLAYLSCFVPVSDDRISNRAVFDKARAQLVPCLPAELDDDTPVLALEVLGQVADQAASLGEAARNWANRTALLAGGDLSSALSALAYAHGLDELPADSEQRLAWLSQNPETRDLVSACVGASFLAAYRAP